MTQKSFILQNCDFLAIFATFEKVILSEIAKNQIFDAIILLLFFLNSKYFID